MTDVPTSPEVRFDDIPEGLRTTPRWLVWKYLPRQKPDGTTVWAKVPLNAKGRAARVNDPSSWFPFEQARKLAGGRFDGVGFVFDGSDGLVGIDLDDSVDALGDLSKMAQDLVDSVPGYWEVSPSGTGVKMWTRVERPLTSFQRSTPHGEIEFYSIGRYFTVTGDTDGLSDLPEFPADLALEAWLTRWSGSAPTMAMNRGDDDDGDLNALKAPVEEFTLERVENEILSKFDPDISYSEWIKVGMALHHQFDGSDEALELWDEWSSSSPKYTEGLTSEKWDSFSIDRNAGSVTLRSMLKEVGVQSIATSKNRIQEAIDKINAETNAAEFEGDKYAGKIRKANLSELEREQLIDAIRKRMKVLTGAMISIAVVRGWLKPERKSRPFPDVNEEGKPLGTHRNVAEVVERMGTIVRYNVITKEDEILIPGEAYTLDNTANATLARVVSECAKYEIPLGHVKPYVTLLADQNQYNPVMTWVDAKEWDGVDRLEALYATVTVAPADEELKRRMLRMWMIGAIAIANNTGQDQNRNVLTFQGAQYQGKTSWLRSLVPTEMNLVRVGHVLDVHRVDSIKQAVSCWLLELGEIDASYDRSNMSGIKAWVSQPMDTLRKPYALAEASFPRRTAIFASVNRQDFLIDDTGNTRWWTLAVLGIDFKHGIDVQQLWAQVATLWRAGERWFMTGEEMEEVERSNARFMTRSPIYEVLLRGYEWARIATSSTWVTATQILQEMGWPRPTPGELRAGANAILRLNGDRQKAGEQGERLYAIPPRRIANQRTAETDFEEESVL